MIESYININTNEEEEFREKKSLPTQYKLLMILLIFLSFHFAIRLDANSNRKLIKLNNNNYYEDIGLVNYNRYYLNNYVPTVKNLDYFNITHVNYDFSLKNNIMRIEYNIQFFEGNDVLISPSDFALYKELQVICTLETFNPPSIIYTYPNIVNNKYYQCIEYFDINEKIVIGIKLYQNIEYLRAFQIKFFTEQKFNYNNFYYQNEDMFDPNYVNSKYINTVQQINKNIERETPNLKRNYLQYPYCSLKRKSIKNNDKWYFRSIYNDHFCFCVGTACLLNIDQKCKQYFYLYVIDRNQHLFIKTDYLFVDFIFAEYSYDDTYPIFKKMYNQDYPVHYLTENLNIYNSYCNKEVRCDPILYVKRANYTINGDFVEKYLTLFLKLKAVVCSRQLNFFANVFYVTDYIKYITIGHSMLYFKYFSDEKDVSEKRKFDKIILPPSERVISLAKSFGWTDDDILQINFPRWDRYNNMNIFNRAHIKPTQINNATENITNNNINIINNITNTTNNVINLTSNITNDSANNITNNTIDITNLLINNTNVITNEIVNITNAITKEITNITNDITNNTNEITNITNDIMNISNNENVNSTNNETDLNNITVLNDTVKMTSIITTKPIKPERGIFMMFAWRNLIKESEISTYYFDNITKILDNEELYDLLERENVKLYFTIHALVINKYRNTYKSIFNSKEYFEFIEQQEIMDTIAKCDLIVTDYSTLVFDFVYLNRPYVLYIPDLDDPEIEDIYKPEYYEFYEKIKSGQVKIDNLFFNVDDLINKIKFYINNDFILEDNIQNFYDSFGIQRGNNIDKLINYLIHSK